MTCITMHSKKDADEKAFIRVFFMALHLTG